MAFEAATLALMSGLHLGGALDGGSKPFRPAPAGIAEAILCVALVGGAVSLRRGRPRRRAVASLAFAIAGFVVGLVFTVRGGDVVDVAYHAVLLPLLVATLAALLWPPGAGRAASSP